MAVMYRTDLEEDGSQENKKKKALTIIERINWTFCLIFLIQKMKKNAKGNHKF